MFLKDQPQDSHERQAAMPELLEDFKSRRVRLLAETRELERLRQQVRTSAEREAASIVTNARRNVRQVLLEARRELLVLVAQLQAVGCEAQAGGPTREVMQAEATSEPDAVTLAEAAGREPFDAREIASGARRDVREVLLEAQAELVALAEEARELRTRIAQRQVAASEFPKEEPGALEAGDGPAEDVAEHAPASYESAPVEYTPLSSSPRVWMAIAAALVFAAVGAVLFLSSGGSTPVPEPSPTAQAAPAADAGTAPSSAPAPPPAAPAAASARGASALLVSLDVRRPAWIRTTIDGRADVGRVYNPGERRTVSGNDEIVLRAGDAGAVFVSVNGAEARALGADGRVVTRRFARPAEAAARPAVMRTANEAVPTAAPDTPPRDVGTTGTTEAPASPPAGAAEREILRAAHQWFEAYFGGDQGGMKDVATSDFWLVDDRADRQRWPATMPGVNRGLQQVRIEVAGDGAVMSARLTERAPVDGEMREHESLVSGVWIRSDGRWRLMGLRFIDPAR